MTAVEAQGKNLLIRFDNGLEVRTHLRMHGSWHRYRPGERWRRPPARARLVIEVPGSVAVCFDAPTVELFEQRTEALHPALSRLGPDLLKDPFDVAEALRRLRDPSRADRSIAEALLDQRALAGIGNEVKNEVLWQARRVTVDARSATSTTRRSACSSVSPATSCARVPRPVAVRATSTGAPHAPARAAGRSSASSTRARTCRG